MPSSDITSLVDSFLNSSPKASAKPPTQFRSFERDNPPTQRITESTVKAKILSGATVYSEPEVRLIAALIEDAESDPFSSDSFLTPSDLKALGLKTVDAGTEVVDEEVGGDESEAGKEKVKTAFSSAEEPMEKLAVTAALCAPDNTVGGNEPIPQEVLATLDVLKSSEVEKPYNMQAQPIPMQAAQAPSASSSGQAPVKTAFSPEQTGVATAPTNSILQTFESTRTDYEAAARAAIMGGKVSLPSGNQPLVEAGTVAAGIEAVRAARASKQGENKYHKPRQPLNKLEGVSESLSQKYESKLGALGDSSDDF